MKKLKLLIVPFLLSINLYSSDVFVDTSFGYSYNPYSKKDAIGSIGIDSLDENGYLYDLALGYNLNKEIFLTINYQYSKLKEIDYDDFYITLNYQLENKLNPYMGVLIGKSFLHWNKDPLNSSSIKDYTSKSFIYGIQAGLKYKITEDLYFIPKLIYTRLNHGTSLISLPAKSYIDHNSKTQLLFGFRYIF